MSEAALEIIALTKHFGDVPAVDRIDLSIPKGSFYGLVGPNGAGKTTLLSLAVGLLAPDSGTSIIGGADVWAVPELAKSRLGVMPDDNALPARLTAREVLSFLGLLRGMRRDVIAFRTDELLRAFDLTAAADRIIADYSSGMTKKIALAVALLHGPEVLVLDEPLEAVDPVSASTIRSILKGFVASGGTVVFSSHVMALVELLCDHVAVIDHGHVVAHGTLEQVRGNSSLDEAFSALVGAPSGTETLSWFAS